MSAEPSADLDRIAGEYVLGLLSAEAAREVESRIDRDRELRVAVGYWEGRLVGLAGGASPVAPSPALWARIAASTAGRPQSAARGRAAPRAPFWERVAVWRALAGAGLAAALVMAFVAFGLQRPGPTYTVVLQATADRSVGWLVQADAVGRLVLVPVAPTDVPPDRALQLWARADDPRGPVSLGVVPADRVFRVPAGDLPPLQPGELFALSLEPAGGSPLGRPTGPVLFAGRAVAAPR